MSERSQATSTFSKRSGWSEGLLIPLVLKVERPLGRFRVRMSSFVSILVAGIHGGSVRRPQVIDPPTLSGTRGHRLSISSMQVTVRPIQWYCELVCRERDGCCEKLSGVEHLLLNMVDVPSLTHTTGLAFRYSVIDVGY